MREIVPSGVFGTGEDEEPACTLGMGTLPESVNPIWTVPGHYLDARCERYFSKRLIRGADSCRGKGSRRVDGSFVRGS
jgi:hypothetical protein